MRGKPRTLEATILRCLRVKKEMVGGQEGEGLLRPRIERESRVPGKWPRTILKESSCSFNLEAQGWGLASLAV